MKPKTDWKQVADELYMVIVGMATAAAYLRGADVRAANDRMQRLRDDIIRGNTK